jgi:hypothetical protein
MAPFFDNVQTLGTSVELKLTFVRKNHVVKIVTLMCDTPCLPFYAPVSKDRGHVVFGLSACLFMSVCLQKL